MVNRYRNGNVTPEPDLQLVDPDEIDRCGAETVDGSPCRRKTDGGLCWQHGESGPGGPDAPEHLGEVGRAEWSRRVSNLVGAGVIGQVDLGILEEACEMYEEARRCQAAVRRHGHIVEGRNGVKKNPASAKHIKYRKEYRLCLKELRSMREEATPTSEGSDDPISGMVDF